jgi:hypothetical protein
MPRTNTSQQVQIVSTTQAPLAPLKLLQAGVPPREVVWWRRLKPDKQMSALTTTRGKLLLEQVRSFAANQAAPAMGQSA